MDQKVPGVYCRKAAKDGDWELDLVEISSLDMVSIAYILLFNALKAAGREVRQPSDWIIN